MGGGKGAVEEWAADVLPGRVMYEISGRRREDGARSVPPRGPQAARRLQVPRARRDHRMKATDLREKSVEDLRELAEASLARDTFQNRAQELHEPPRRHEPRSARRSATSRASSRSWRERGAVALRPRRPRRSREKPSPRRQRRSRASGGRGRTEEEEVRQEERGEAVMTRDYAASRGRRRAVAATRGARLPPQDDRQGRRAPR